MTNQSKIYLAKISMITPAGGNAAMTCAAVRAGLGELRLQFHKGGHNIKEKIKDDHGKWVEVPDDERLHMAYDEFLINKLETMNERMTGWSNECPLCKEGDKKKDKVQPSVRVNEALDRLSELAKTHISGNRENWTLFISDLAWIYHYPVCPHHTKVEY
ncbi:MAG: hypothetical protein OEZ39_00020 [Gammaproteobacteria bacterium]|nr:hypothetical protein [Gammaproteobacteria bacterium]MDH5650232.1 hypothetical protein [Gammaproteobacteria bacterium]